MKWTFFFPVYLVQSSSLQAAGLFARSRLRNTEGGRAVHDRAVKCGSQRGSVARALGAQRSAHIWQTNQAIAFRPASASQDNGKSTFQFFVCSTASLARRAIASSFPRSCSDGHYCARADHYYACVDTNDTAGDF